jgi:hypothetical protein
VWAPSRFSGTPLRGLAVKKLLPVLCALGAALAAPAALAPADAAPAAAPCGLPTAKPLWIEHTTPGVITRVFGKPGMVLGVSTGDFPAKLRATGARTVYWDMNLNRRVGTPTAPTDPATMVDRADRLFTFAASQSGCAQPRIVLNELSGANLETPWSANNQQYRDNVLAFVRRLAERKARPYLLIPAAPFTASDEAAAWWREVSRHADLVSEVYFTGPTLHKLGPILGSRRIRVAMRQRLGRFATIGIPASKQGIVLGFQTSRGAGGREGLEPAQAWYRIVKLQTLAVKQVARETGLGTVVSWGWASYRTSDHDDEKVPSACVYLWARDTRLCNGPAAAGPGFEASLTEGQIVLAGGAQCVLGRRPVSRSALTGLTRVTGDRDVAFSILLGRMAEAPYADVPLKRVNAAERAVIVGRFRGSRAAYLAALRRAGATAAVARAGLADELHRLAVESRFRAPAPPATQVTAFYEAYPELLTRSLQAKPAPWWLGGRPRGVALQPLAPATVFALATGRKASVADIGGSYAVKALGATQPLGSLTLAQARPAISAALAVFARRAAFETWSSGRQEYMLRTAVCARDDLPVPGSIRVSSYLPFLSLTG